MGERRVPPDDVLRALHAAGEPARVTAERAGVSTGAVTQAWVRLGLTRNARHADVLPWPLGPAARQTHAEYVRVLSAAAQGRPQHGRKLRCAVAWARALHEEGRAVAFDAEQRLVHAVPAPRDARTTRLRVPGHGTVTIRVVPGHTPGTTHTAPAHAGH